MTLAVSIVEWAGLGVTVVVSFSGGVFALYRWRREAFRPSIEALLAAQGDSLRITVTNKGRGEGTVHGLDVLTSQDERISLSGAGGTFQQFKLANGSAEVFDFNAPEGRDFDPEDTIVVSWGKHEQRLHPRRVQVSFFDAGTAAGTRVKQGEASAPAA